MTIFLTMVKRQMIYELEMAGIDGASWCCVDTDMMYEWVTSVDVAARQHIEEVLNHNRLKDDTWNYEQKLLSENSEMRNALQAVLNLQTRGFITLGDTITDMIKGALV